MFDLRLLAHTGGQEREQNTLDNNSYFGCMNKKFGPLSKGEGEDPIEETDNG